MLPQVELGLHSKALRWDQGQEGSCAPCESTQHPERGAGRSLKPTEGHRSCKEDKLLVITTQVFSISSITSKHNLETLPGLHLQVSSRAVFSPQKA